MTPELIREIEQFIQEDADPAVPESEGEGTYFMVMSRYVVPLFKEMRRLQGALENAESDRDYYFNEIERLHVEREMESDRP